VSANMKIVSAITITTDTSEGGSTGAAGACGWVLCGKNRERSLESSGYASMIPLHSHWMITEM
jgi:hypothetical protein